jgi:hypothetical protein
MKRALLSVLVGVATAAPAMAQTGAAAPPDTSGGWMAIGGVVMLVLVLAAVGVTVKLFDLKQKREADAVLLQAQLSDALLREPSLSGLVVTPTAHVPFWSGSPAEVELHGRVPSHELRDHVRQIVEREAARIRPDFVIEDRIAVVPEFARRVA